MRTDVICLMRQYAYVIEIPKRRVDSLWFLFAKTVNYTYIEELFYRHFIDNILYFNKRSRGGAGELFSYLTVNMSYGETKRVRILTRQLMWLINSNKPQSKTNETKICWQKYGF
jgi:hypothetical protein